MPRSYALPNDLTANEYRIKTYVLIDGVKYPAKSVGNAYVVQIGVTHASGETIEKARENAAELLAALKAYPQFVDSGIVAL